MCGLDTPSTIEVHYFISGILDMRGSILTVNETQLMELLECNPTNNPQHLDIRKLLPGVAKRKMALRRF